MCVLETFLNKAHFLEIRPLVNKLKWVRRSFCSAQDRPGPGRTKQKNIFLHIYIYTPSNPASADRSEGIVI